jgi:archaeoflavoprotein AfpA
MAKEAIAPQGSEQNGAEVKQIKLAWALTGAGDLVAEIYNVMEEVKKSGRVEITVFMSKAATQVAKWYQLWEKLPNISDKVKIEKDANTPFVSGALQTGKYDMLLVAPATGNSVAKIVHGIADTLITNAVAMTNKTDVRVYILPVEKEGQEVNTRLPDGNMLRLHTRNIDADNTAKLRKMKGISVLETPEDIKRILLDQ